MNVGLAMAAVIAAVVLVAFLALLFVLFLVYGGTEFGHVTSTVGP